MYFEFCVSSDVEAMPCKKNREILRVGLPRLVWHLIVEWSLSNRSWIELVFGSLYLLVGLIVRIVLVPVIH